MGTRAKAGTSLEALVKLAMPLLKEAERQCPRTGPGAKPVIPDWFIGVLIMVAVVRRKKAKSAQFRFVTDNWNRHQIGEVTGAKHFPSRSTFFSRYRRCYQLFCKAIELQGKQAIAEKVIDASQVAVDKSLVRGAVGPGTSTKKSGERFPGVWIVKPRGDTRNIMAGCTAIASKWWSRRRVNGSCFPCWHRSERRALRRCEPSLTKSIVSLPK